MHKGIFRPNYIFNNDAYFLDSCELKFPLIFFFFYLNPFKHQQALHYGVLNNEKQHKQAPVKFREDRLYFSAFYADFCLCPKSVIITTLNYLRIIILAYVSCGLIRLTLYGSTGRLCRTSYVHILKPMNIATFF